MAATDTPPALETHLVREFVANAHGDLEAVRNALDEHPALANSCWDWGAGDWETGLGAASHVGRRDIAELLLVHGARLDIFAAAMLGELQVVRAVLAAQPETLHALGPHSIPLRAHAEAGGERARPVLDLLDSSA
jgi:hypothetical protein